MGFCADSQINIDPQTIEAYQKAKEKGERYSNQFKLVTLGAEGAGKSSTIGTLFNEKFDPRKKSTIGAAINTCTVDHHMAAGWQKFSDTALLLKKLKNQHQQEIRVEMKSVSTEGASYSPQVEEMPKNIITEVKNMFKETAGNETMTDGDTRIMVFDLGGQEVYYEIHYLFLAIEDIALLVFDASKNLDAEVISRERVKNSKNKIPTREMQSNIKTIEMHLQSVYSRGQKAPKGFISQRIPVVIMVGAHAENITLEQQNFIVCTILERFNGKKFLEHLPSDITMAFHFIGNSNPNLEVVQHLRGVILQAANPVINEKRPISYLEFEQEIFKKSRKTVRLNKAEAVEMAKSVGIENEKEVDALLKYHMYKGILLYFPEEEFLKNEIFISPQEVSDLVCTIITTHHYHAPTTQLRQSDGRYNKYALLEEALFDYILSEKNRIHDKNIIVGLLKLFHLATEVPLSTKFPREFALPKDGKVFFVPSLLVYDEKDVYHKKDGDIVVQYYFPDNFLPERIFNQIIVKIINWCYKGNHQLNQ